MAAETSAETAPARALRLRRGWLIGTVLVTVVPVLVAVALGPRDGTGAAAGLVWLLFIGSSVHIGATAWFYTVPEVRAHMRLRPGRYLLAPIALVVLGAVLAAAVPARAFTWVLLGFFAWQFFHFQRQNLGVAALAARSLGAGRLTTVERAAITGAGVGGIAALLGRPELLGLHGVVDLALLRPLGLLLFAGSVLAGLVALAVRDVRPPSYVVVWMLSLLFFTPVFVVDSPYGAVAGITIAHGLQYLLLVGLLAAAPAPPLRPAVGVLIFVNLAVVLGLALERASHLHDGGGLARAVYGGYLGVLTAHFVVDAGLWRLREEFPRRFLSERLPYLLVP